MRAVFLVCLLLAVFEATSETCGHFFPTAGESAKDVVNRHLDLIKQISNKVECYEKLSKLVMFDAEGLQGLEYHRMVRSLSSFLLQGTADSARFRGNENIIFIFINKNYLDSRFRIGMSKKTSNPEEWFFDISSKVRGIVYKE